ncbi:MAG: M20/M25/M40 family metallo-hydrolase [Fidelibacterota bacterium]|nr:MAG: M20/M25/M40 family metallo-hydrolase [Candidatus Neomarinimicrobiota bacterium]
MNLLKPFSCHTRAALLFCLIPLLFTVVFPQPEGLTPVEQEIAATVEQQSDQAVDLLRRSVNINSGTFNVKGVRRVGKLFQKELAPLGFDVQWIDMPPELHRAGHLFAYRRGTRGKGVLLIGHLDTVFDKNTPFKRFEIHDTTATGPGTEDMKGGNVVIVYALKALHDLSLLENTTIIVALHGDEEEAGRPTSISRRDIQAAAEECDVALGFEGGVSGTITVARRGISGWRLETAGIRGHSSDIFNENSGNGAIYETARILNGFFEEVRGEEYLTFNPGVILGGTEVHFDPALYRGSAFGLANVIAQKVVVSGDLRFISDAQKDSARAKMRTIVADHLPGTSASISFTDSYPAMAPTEGNYELLALYDQVNRDLGYGPIEALDPGSRGAADVSFVARLVDCLDGLGVEGNGGHSIHEKVYLPSMDRATKRAAVLVYRLTR